jgi:Fe-S-cluster containining protein
METLAHKTHEQAESPPNGRAASGVLGEMRTEMTGGFLYTHHRANANTRKTLEVASFAYALIELLVEKGLLTVEELDERKKEVAERLAAKFRDDGMGVVRQEPEYDKYSFDSSVQVGCQSRLHLCRAACCRLQFALSRQDVDEVIVRWDLSRPYMIQRGKDGYCVHLERDTCHCAVYQHRPIPCRAYDCRNDERIWKDFEKRIISPELEKLLKKDGNET